MDLVLGCQVPQGNHNFLFVGHKILNRFTVTWDANNMQSWISFTNATHCFVSVHLSLEVINASTETDCGWKSWGCLSKRGPEWCWWGSQEEEREGREETGEKRGRQERGERKTGERREERGERREKRWSGFGLVFLRFAKSLNFREFD